MKRIRHQMILASAGSGKTYTLVSRYLSLLAHGIEPERIMALTFTRKAAGEFLQKIFLRLTLAAQDKGEAESLASETGADQLDCATCREMLSRLVAEIGSLQLGTIDSFFGRIVGAFPYELGLTRPHRIMDGFEESMARRMAMEKLLAYSDDKRTSELLQLYKDLTWGSEEKNVYGLFEDKLKDYHSLFLENRDPAIWGQAERIFLNPPWWMGKPGDRGSLVDQARAEVSSSGWSASTVSKFNELLDTLETWQPGQQGLKGLLWERLLAAHDNLADGHALITFNRADLRITPPLSGYLLELVKLYVREEIARRLVTTRSLGALMSEFDQHYETLVRESGSLVFGDLPMLLIKGLGDRSQSLQMEDIIYRLDGRTDHWLIDEFQDTSRIQWKVLSEFADEILQDPSGRRSFFYVGDIKQSIYGWRGGDSRLFEEIYEQYRHGENGIESSGLNLSWRSSPAVLDCVNRLFGGGITPELAGQAVARRWNAHWQDHKASPKTRDLPGHAAWGLVDPDATVAEGCVDWIRRMKPLEKGFGCAVLVRKNKQVLEITQALRKAGIPASMEGVVHIAMDNVAGTWMRAFFYSLCRADETFPAEFLELAGFPFPLAERRRMAGLVRAAITTEGYAEGVRRVLGLLGTKIRLTPFLRRRSEQLLEAATRFEGSGLDSLEAFVHFLESSTVEESTLKSQIQVMTVHKAKGFDFDMVVVAGFGPDPLLRSGSSAVHAERSDEGEIDWILDMPNKDVLEQDPVLLGALGQEDSRNTFEACCLLYVAMTRARRGLYCISSPPQRNSSKTTWHMVLENAFSGMEHREDGLIEWQAEWGDPSWADAGPAAAPAKREALSLKPLDAGEFPIRQCLRAAASPSAEAHQAARFPETLPSSGGRRFGSVMHDFLATMEWLEIDEPAAVEAVLSRSPAMVRERLGNFLGTPLAREVFGRPAVPCKAWREKPYILRTGDRVSNGIIDRANLILDQSGNPVEARIYDFKTDALDTSRPADEQLRERYAVQLERYEEAVAVLTGLAPEKITTMLVPV